MIQNLDRPAVTRLALVTDAWAPQVNGVVRTLGRMVDAMTAGGAAVKVIAPADFRTLPCPTYPEIRLSLVTPAMVGRRILAHRPDALHIATEGPLGIAARHWALRHGVPFTTAFHTRFPEYIAARTGLPLSLSYGFMRRFHNAGVRTMVATPSLADDLRQRGFSRVAMWCRGVDLDGFSPALRGTLPPRDDGELARLPGLPRPLMLYVGRVAVEKNIQACLNIAGLPGTRVVIGDGPARADLMRRHPDAVFPGLRRGAALAWAYAQADVFVFPSRTDTFGLVMLEAMASGVPVAGYPVTGPIDVVDQAGGTGALDEDLGAAIRRALPLGGAAARSHAERFTWEACANRFQALLAPFASTDLPAPAAEAALVG
jgi:glycosyltransferase involved in cell wall biosynthesis